VWKNYNINLLFVLKTSWNEASFPQAVENAVENNRCCAKRMWKMLWSCGKVFGKYAWVSDIIL